MTSPLLTVVLCTFNRADVVVRTLDAVLAQEGVDFEVVVVDDGSTDATPERLAAAAGRDARVRPVRQDNAGLSAARNTGLAAAAGAWVVFLDDDDVPDPGWLAALARPTDDPGVGVTCCGAIAVGPDGREIFPLPVIALPEPFGGVRGSYRAGTFAVRTELCRQAGGYLDGLGTSHQFELFLRLQDEARRRALRIESTDANLLRIERRPADDRRSTNPYIIYDATTWILERHPDRFARAPEQVAAFDGVRGHAAARIEDWPTARRHFRRAARLQPRRRRSWQRLVLACVPPLGRWAWSRHGSVRYPPSTVGVPVQAADGPATGQADKTGWAEAAGGTDGTEQADWTDRTRATDGTDGTGRELFLAWRYRENPAPDGAGAVPPPVDPAVRKLVARLSRRVPDLLSLQLSAGLEREPDPVARLQQVARDASGAPTLLTLTDRRRSDPDRPFGPPSNPDHRREWTYDQFLLLLRSTGFRIERAWRRGSQRLILVRGMAEPPTRIN